jgi:molybdopterin/thiamine biosynthesis adenylyltransferase
MSLLDDQPQRMAREKRQLEALARGESWFRMQDWSATAAGDLEVRFTLKLLNGTFDGVLAYPRFFPDVPAFIRPLRKGESWSGHQYLGSGVLCLERGPDNWDPSVTGVDLVRSANKLLWSEVLHILLPDAAPAPSRHHLTPGQAVRGEPRRFLLTSEFAEHLAAGAAGSLWLLETATTRLGDAEVTLPTAVGAEPLQRLTYAPALAGAEPGRGWAIAVQDLPRAKVATLADLAAFAGGAGKLPDDLHNKTVVVCSASRFIRAFALSASGGLSELAVIDASSVDANRLPADYAKLGAMVIAVVGLGSLGSKIAVSLARSGARKFALLDADVLLPQNLVRNDLDWRDVGFAKVEATAERIRLVAPGAEVLALSLEVAGQENPHATAQLAELIGTCDLVVDATANPDTFVMLAALCKRAGVALTWGEVFAGGFGALMARSRPGLDADPLSIRAHVFGTMGTMQPVPRVEARRYALDVAGRVLVAGDAEVSHLAAAMTAFAVDAVCRRDASEYPVAAYLLGFKRFWEFKAPFDTIPIECPAASEAVPAQALSEDEVSALGELVKAVQGGAGAAGNSSP